MIKRFFNKHSILLLWFILCLIMLVYLSGALKVQSDISFFLPKEQSAIDSVLKHQLTKGEAGKIILIALRDPEPSFDKAAAIALADINKKLARQLRSTKQFSLVQNGQLDTATLIAEPFYQYRYLIADNNKDSFSIERLSDSFDQLLQRIQFMLMPVEQKLFAEDPQMIWLSLLKQWQTQRIEKRHGVWFDKTGKQSLLFVKSKAEGYDLMQQKNNLETIHHAIKQIIQKRDSTQDIDYVLTGAPVFALASKKAISKQIQTISIIASMTLMAFLYWFFRSVKLIILIGSPLAFAVLSGMTSVILMDGFIHGITIAFGITIIGIAVDYPVHFYTHSLYPTVITNTTSTTSTLSTSDGTIINRETIVIKSIWPMIRLGLLTTLIGFSAITLSDFSGLQQLGIFAISGLLAAALYTRFVLPQFHIAANGSSANTLSENGSYQIVRKVIQWPRPRFLSVIAFVLPILAVFYIINHSHLWQKDLSALSPVPQSQKQNDFELRQAMGVPELRYALILHGMTVEELLQRSEKIRPQLDSLIEQGMISGYDMAANYLPSIRHQKEQQQHLPSSNELQDRLEAALQNTALDTEAFSPCIKAVDDSKRLLPLSVESLLSETKVSDTNVKQNFVSSKIKMLLFQKEGYQKENANWTAIIPFKGVQKELQTNELIRRFSEPVSLLDLKSQTETMLEGYRNDAILWFCSGLILILAILLSSSRKFSELLPLVWPFTGAVILTIATLLLLGYSLSIFHLVTLLLVVGLGIDYSIFTVMPQRQVDDSLQSPEIAQISVIICLVSTLIMFAALSLSDLPVLKAIGLTASLGALYAFLLTLFINKAPKI